MKKRYIKPQTEMFKIEVSGMMCTSTLNMNGGGTGAGNVTSADSREFEWDDF